METTTAKRASSRSREWERQRRNKFNDAITKLGEIVKAINKTNCPDFNGEDVQYPKVEIVQKAIICLTNCNQEKTQLKAEVLALQVKLDSEKNKTRKDASTQVYFGVTKKRKDEKYVKLLMLKKSRSKKVKEKPLTKEASRNGTTTKLPTLLPRNNLVDKKGSENTIVVLPAAPYIFPQRPILFPSVPPAIILVDQNLQPLNRGSAPIFNRNNGDITKTTMVNILPISAYSRPLSATKSKKNNVKLKSDGLKKPTKKSKPPINTTKESKNKIELKDKIEENQKQKNISQTTDSENNKINDSKDTKEKEVSSKTSAENEKMVIATKDICNSTKTIQLCSSELDKISKPNVENEVPKVPNSVEKLKCTDSIVKELTTPIAITAAIVKSVENIKSADENTKCSKSINDKETVTEKDNKLPNILDTGLCDNVVDAGNARLELAEEFLATSPTAAFLMSFPLVSGNRADSPAEEPQNTVQSSSIQNISKETQRRNELVPQPIPFYDKPNTNDIKVKPSNKVTPCNVTSKQSEQKYVENVVIKEHKSLVTPTTAVTKTSSSITQENPFLNLSMPSLISTNCATADTGFNLDFDCSINKTMPSQSGSYVNSNNFFYKGDPFATVKSTIYSTSSISSSHEFNSLGLYPCAMEKYTSAKNKPEYAGVDENLMKMGSSRLTYDIDLGWSHKGFDFVNCTTTANTFNKDILTTTSAPYTTSYNPFNPDFHIPLVSTSNKKDITNKPTSSFSDPITSFYSQATNLWADDVPFYTNSNMTKNVSSKNQNYPPLDHIQSNKPNTIKHFDTKVNEPIIHGGIKPSNNTTNQQIPEKYTKKSPSKMHINWMTSEIRPMQSNCNPLIHSEIKQPHKTSYNQTDHSTKKQDQNDGNYFPISMHNFPTQPGQDEFQVWPSARTLGTTEISIEPPPINLPTLVGDLALGPHDKKKTADVINRVLPQVDIQNCGNFLSVTQLMNRSNDNMTSRYHASNIDAAKTVPIKQNHFINDGDRKTITSHNMENHIPQPCYVFNEPKIPNAYDNTNQFSHTKAKTNTKTEKSSKSHKNNYSTEALLRGASCTQKVQDNNSAKFMMPPQKYADYGSAQDTSVAQVSHFPPILDYSDNSYASQQFSGTTLYNTTTNTISNSFYSNFMPGSSNLMSSNYSSGPFTSEFVDYNQSAECNYTNHKYEELKMRNNPVYQSEKLPSSYKSSRRESAAKHKLECSKKESSKKYQSKKAKINTDTEDWSDPSHLLWQNKMMSKKHPNLISEELPFPNYVGNQMSTQYQTDLFNNHLMPSNVQSMGHNVDRSLASFPATSRANFNLSTIFPEITMKVQ